MRCSGLESKVWEVWGFRMDRSQAWHSLFKFEILQDVGFRVLGSRVLGSVRSP